MDSATAGTGNEKVLGTENTNSFTQRIKWLNVVSLSLLHLLAIYGSYVGLFCALPLTPIFNFVYAYVAGLGVTAGAHRLWSHRSYKATFPLRVILVYGYISAGMNSLFNWVRDHRVHHKFSETDADPHNAARGLFFSHVGWLMQEKHPEVKRRGREVDMSDILADPVVALQEKYFLILQPIFSLLIPICIPCLYWNETLANSFFVSMARWALFLNVVWAVNSFAHIYGNRPYNKKINPAENLLVSLFALGEGWHNYHHTFPWDYKTAELCYYMNPSTLFIDMFAFIGWAYDRKQPSPELVQRTVLNSGDGSHFNYDLIAKEMTEESTKNS